MNHRIVIIGGGQAGGDAAAALRGEGYGGDVVLIGAEQHLPYSRPPLSKAYLMGETGATSLGLRPASYYEKAGIQTLLGRRVTAIDTARQSVQVDDGTELTYDDVIVATGGTPRRLHDPALDGASNVHYLRTIDDVDGLRASLRPGAHLTVIGGGYVGLEVAAAARKRGLRVTVLEAAARLLARVAGEEISEFFRRVHTDEGVDVRLRARIEGFRRDGADDRMVRRVLLAGGQTISTDAVLIGIGLDPDVDVAAASGLAVDDGIVVDALSRASAPHVYAIGDVARYPCTLHGGTRRLESVPNASEHARAVAATIVHGRAKEPGIPWFWSDQYDFKLQSAGLAAGHDHVAVLGSVRKGRAVTALYLRGGRLIAADAIGRPRDFVAAKRLIAQGALLDQRDLSDPDLDLRALALRVRVPT